MMCALLGVLLGASTNEPRFPSGLNLPKYLRVVSLSKVIFFAFEQLSRVTALVGITRIKRKSIFIGFQKYWAHNFDKAELGYYADSIQEQVHQQQCRNIFFRNDALRTRCLEGLKHQSPTFTHIVFCCAFPRENPKSVLPEDHLSIG